MAKARGRRVFPGRPDQIRVARSFVVGVLDSRSPLRDTAGLLVSEAATNAILHSSSGRDGATFEVGYAIGTGQLRVEVRDQGSSTGPRRRVHEPESLTGRGLELFELLSSRWGVTEHAAGRTVWFELDGLPSAS